MLVLTNSAVAQMAEGNCEPFCQGVRACDVTQTRLNTTTQREQHNFRCGCHGEACRDLALMSSAGMAVDPALPMEICDYRQRRVKLQMGEFP